MSGANSDSNQPWSKFFWAKWEGDEALKQVGLAAQGLWMRMLCIMHKGEPYGHLTTASGRPLDAKALANGVGKSVDEIEALLAELADWEVFSKTEAGVIFSRRLVRDRLEYLKHRENGRKGGMPSHKGPPPTADLPAEPGVEGGVYPGVYPESEVEEEKEPLPSEEAPASGVGDVDLFGQPPAGEQKPTIPDDTWRDLEVISGTTVKGRLIATQRMLLKLAEGNVDLLVEVARETVARGAKKANIGTFKTILADRLEQRKKGTPPPLRLVADKGRPAAAPTAPAPDPNDLWGINGFCAAWAQAGKLRPSSNRLYGEWVYGRGYNFDAIAKDVAKAARLHVTWRGSWEPLAGWLDRGCTAHDIKAGIAKAVASDPSPTQSLRRFDKFIAASKAA